MSAEESSCGLLSATHKLRRCRLLFTLTGKAQTIRCSERRLFYAALLDKESHGEE